MSKTLDLIVLGLRSVAMLLPTMTREGHGDDAAKVLNTIATLGERGDEAFNDLRELVGKLETMKGVDRAEKAVLMQDILSTSAAIQDAVRDLRDPPPADPPPVDPPPAGGDAAGKTETGDAGGSGESEKT